MRILFGKLFGGATLRYKYGVVLIVLSFLVYGNTLWNGYALDDSIMITQNSYVKQGLKGVPILLTTSQLKGNMANVISDKYRPLALAMFAVEYGLFGLNPMPGHLLNILFYAACVLALFVFLVRLFGEERIVLAFVAALIFLVHPLHSEVVANIKSRDELLCFLFAFTSLNCFLKYADGGKVRLLVWGSFLLFLSIISKETVITFLGIIPLIFFIYKNENRKRSLLITAGMLVSFAAFFVIRVLVLRGNASSEAVEVRLVYNLLALAPDAASRLATEIVILGSYLKVLFVPYPLIFFYGPGSIPYNAFGDVTVWVWVLLYLSLLAGSVYRLYKYKKDPLAFGILFYLCTISLFSNILFFIGTAFANRFAFFPSVGYCLFLAFAFEKWVVGSGEHATEQLLKVKSMGVLLPVVLLYGVMAVARNSDWKNNHTLCMADAPKAPNDTWIQYFTGLQLQKEYEAEPDSVVKRQLNDESIGHFKKSLEIYPDNSEAHADIGVAYMHENNPTAAELHFKRAIMLNPVHVNAITNLATLYFMEQDFADAATYYEKAVALSTDSSAATYYYNMGICYGRLNQGERAIYCFKKVTETTPEFDNYKSYGNIAILYEMAGDMDSARKYEGVTKQHYPEFHLKQ